MPVCICICAQAYDYLCEVIEESPHLSSNDIQRILLEGLQLQIKSILDSNYDNANAKQHSLYFIRVVGLLFPIK